MGMNRKWNMRVFELHGAENATKPSVIDDESIGNEIAMDTQASGISMQKYPFDFSEIKSNENAVTIKMSDLTANETFETDISNISQWSFVEGNPSKMSMSTQNDDIIIAFFSVVKAIFNIPSESTRWVLQFDLLTDPSTYRSFFYFDGVADSDNGVRYQYGIDIPGTGYPHLEEFTEYDTFTQTNRIENTIADEQYFTGEDYMPITVTRWDNIYTLYYDSRYMITIPTENDSINRIGFWTWSGSQTRVKNPKFYEIENDSDATNIIIDELFVVNETELEQDNNS